MYKVLQIVLLIIGLLLIGYGLYDLFTPEFAAQAGPIKIEAEGKQTQAYAMIALGVLSLIAGIAFSRKKSE